MDENNTLIDSRNLVISKKICRADRKDDGEYVTDKLMVIWGTKIRYHSCFNQLQAHNYLKFYSKRINIC